VVTKRDLKKNNKWLPPAQLQKMTQDVHPIKEFRNVPTKRLTRRLGLDKFTAKAPLFTDAIQPKSVTIPLQQHAGAPAVAVVKEGERVEAGSVIAKAADGQLSVPIHASISGTVKSVGKCIVIENG
jgi:Na+-translocating ferredoxin:NAD+ oxidoreductase RnfC subunit